MKVSELITRLQRFMDDNGDMIVVTPGFDESGYDDVTPPQKIAVIECDPATHKECPYVSGKYSTQCTRPGCVSACLLDF